MLEATLSENIATGQKIIAKETVAKESVIKKFISWVDSQEENRFLWLGIALMGGILAVLPLTLSAIVLWANNSSTLWIIVLVINVAVYIAHLAAQPVKVTLPMLLFSWVASFAIIVYCIVVYFLG